MIPLLHRFTHPLVTATLQRLLNELYPPHCLICELEMNAPGICLPCRLALPTLADGPCHRCGHFPDAPTPVCSTCLNSPYPPDAFYCPFLYESAIIPLIISFKFNDRPYYHTLLANLIWEKLSHALIWESPDLIIPIPLHVRKLLHRRYNQSALLAGVVARHLHRPLVTNRLFRIRMTMAQARLDRTQRLVNLKGAFQAEKVAGKSILLVDDVMTSGSTLMEATATLKQAGASRVALLCLARTAPDHHTQAR